MSFGSSYMFFYCRWGQQFIGSEVVFDFLENLGIVYGCLADYDVIYVVVFLV